MPEMVTAAQMRAIERAAIDSGAVSGLTLMERAGQGVVDAILARHPEAERAFPCAAVLCGPGNNGGDGFVIARLLHERGWQVHVFWLGDAARQPADARTNRERWQALGAVHPYTAEALLSVARRVRADGAETWILVDALFGTGQRGKMDEVLAPLHALTQVAFEDVAAAPVPLEVCVDVPTGYDTDTGAELARSPVMGTVVTFHATKPVHAVPNVCQEDIVVVDIGLGPWDGARKDSG